MATDNRGVMVYLPQAIEEYFSQYCIENNFTRKDKEMGENIPSLGTGIVKYLTHQVLGIAPNENSKVPSAILSDRLTKNEVLDLIDRSMTSEVSSNRLNEAIGLAIEPMADSIESLRAELSEVTEFARNLQGEISKLKKRFSDRVTPAAVESPESSPKDAGLTMIKLAALIGYPLQPGESRQPTQKEAEDGIIKYAAELGQTWVYDAKSRKFFGG